MFILIVVFFSIVVCLFYFFVFLFQKEHKLNVVSRGKKLSLDTLIVSGGWKDMVMAAGECIWSCPLLKTGYEIINHDLITILSQRWHAETNNFHQHVGFSSYSKHKYEMSNEDICTHPKPISKHAHNDCQLSRYKKKH